MSLDTSKAPHRVLHDAVRPRRLRQNPACASLPLKCKYRPQA
jgi:hypothetical protein